MQNNLTKSELKNKIENLEKYFSKYKNQLHIDKLLEVKKKLDNQEYKIAVVANMSSGKSTFINALFGKEVLPTNSEAVTDSATYIYSNPNIEKKAEIFFSDGRENIIVTENLERELGLYAYKDEKIERDEKSRKEDLSQYKNVERIDLYYPFKNLQTSSSEDFSITFIDTPGPNSTGDYGDEHKRKTRNVLRDANMAIFVFDYGQLDANLKSDEQGLWTTIEKKIKGDKKEILNSNEDFEIYFLINKIDMAIEDNLKLSQIIDSSSKEEYELNMKKSWFYHEEQAVKKLENAAIKHGIKEPKVYTISSHYALLDRNKQKMWGKTASDFKSFKDIFEEIFLPNWEEEYIKYLGIVELENDINQYINIGLKEKILKKALNNLIDIKNNEINTLQTNIQTLNKPKEEATEKVNKALIFLSGEAKELEKDMNDRFKKSSEIAIVKIDNLIDSAIERELYSKIDEMAKISIAYAEEIAYGRAPRIAQKSAMNNYNTISLSKKIKIELENKIDTDFVFKSMQDYMKSLFEDYKNNYLDVKIDLKNTFIEYELEISNIFREVKERLNSELQDTLDVDIQSVDIQTVDINSTLSFEVFVPSSVLDYNHEQYSNTVTKTRKVERFILNPLRWFGDKYTTEEYIDKEHISRHTLTINPIDLKDSIEKNMNEITEQFSDKEKENYKNAIIELRKNNSSIFNDFKINKQKEMDKLKGDIQNSEKELIIKEAQIEYFNNLTKE